MKTRVKRTRTKKTRVKRRKTRCRNRNSRYKMRRNLKGGWGGVGSSFSLGGELELKNKTKYGNQYGGWGDAIQP